MTKLKLNFKNLMYNVAFLFRPITPVAVSFVFLLVIVILLVTLIMNLDKSSTLYQVLLAILTGATASLLVAIMMELYNNYRFNSKRQRELREYLSYMAQYEIAQNSIVKTNAKHEFTSELGGGRAYAVFIRLKNIIPTLKEALNQRDYLYRKELQEIDIILQDYRDIVKFTQINLFSEFYDLVSGKTTAKEVENEALKLDQERKDLKKEGRDSTEDNYESIVDYPDLFHFLKKEAKYYVQNKNAPNLPEEDFDQVEYIIEKAIFFECEIFNGYFEVDDNRAKYVESIDDEDSSDSDAMSYQDKRFESRSNIISYACGNIDEAMVNLHKRVKKEPYFWMIASYKS